MLSIRGRLISFLLRNRHLLSFSSKKKVIDWNTYEAILGFRKDVEKGAGRFGKLPEGIDVVPVSIDNLYADWILPAKVKKDKAILYFHGGGYISGTCKAHREITAKFVKESNIGALLFEYRLAPEHQFPAALDDSIAAYQWLLNQGISSSNIVFMGDSAGGGLCLAALLALRDQGSPLPAAVVALSPWTDLKCTGESYVTKAKICLSPEGTGLAFAKHYAGSNDPALPYISPLYGDLHGLPPMLIFVGGDETMRDDSIRFAEKAKQAGTDITLTVEEGLFHCYPATAPLFPEATQALRDIGIFINKHIDKEKII
ncbi:Acetyl esterase/lipase [Natronincola peptidivorans]|uniref:Acetyl esterase/lipase n=1 Tax=Natronincola peptidivorans TaxID=426128 RepID=A0A1I0A3Q0_9FIRM|nr:alpha/beta hydrolase [Natronincola peptidivorans]SES87798.1 Acetyl esterase/lipase [Natronincola peptidivorans]